ncbi:amino acid transporter [Burkholderia territorii]|uniref:APC family permease n=1 Tax=Burkholderia territorii TaxID=1503055 RepID=UPI00075B34B0|nr:amino acid permease [Burkholderia territorii]KVQ55267.1 amino acid transporter [Burkholderia territorii]KWE40841.1 amino acid transporter [Burkholderia territorii]KWE44105.1 amino acid transporter [Burkholderia territorii]KWE45778.1 amino acid transporter [Burkholderia territorii]KWH04819.1 amino acid transporter [Burkholderia territorii]
MSARVHSAERARLRRSLGLRGAVAVGVGGTLGGGIFVLVGQASALAGPAALLSFALAFVAALVIALPYAELACRYPQAGGGYAFVREVLGRRWGFMMGWVFWGSYVFVSGYVTLGFGSYLNVLTGLPQVWCAVALVLACVLINVRGVEAAGKVQVIVIGLAIVGLLGFAVAGASAIQLTRLTPWAPSGFTGIFAGALVAFLAFGGFDMVSAAGEEIDRPEKNLPRAILLTLAIVLGIYLLVAFTALGTVGWRTLGASPAPLSAAAQQFMGDSGGRLVAAIAVVTTAATANAVLVVTSRILFAMARDGLLPSPLARVDPNTGTPNVATIVSGGMLIAMALFGSSSGATAVGGFLYVLHFLPPLVVLVTLRRDKSVSPAFRMPLPRILLPLAFVMTVLLLVASGTRGVAGGAVWIVIGLLVCSNQQRSSRDGH